jgi:hypothetical protein
LVNDRLIHDIAWMMATCLAEEMGSRLSKEEARGAFATYSNAARASIEVYEIRMRRFQSRPRPGEN